MEWEARRGRGIRGEKQHRRFFGNICGKERRERNPHVKERWCVGRKEGRAWRLQWLFVGPRFFFMEAVGWGQWTVATVDLARRGDSGERNGGAVSSKL